MKKLVVLGMVLFTALVAQAGNGGWTTQIRCNDGALIVEANDYNSNDVQVVLFDRGVINYFSDAMRGIMHFDMRNAPKWIERTEHKDTLNYVDFSNHYESSGVDAYNYGSFQIAREGNGLHINLLHVRTWGEGGYYDQTDGMWRGFNAKKTVQFLRNWYFQSCEFRN